MNERGQDEKLEDVLSSVRRLVSAELPKATTQPSQGPGALVLTSEQRVESGPRASAGAKSLEARIAELEAAVSERADEYEPDGSEDQAQHRPDRVVFRSREPSRGLSQLSLVDTDDFEVGDAPDRYEPTPFRRHSQEAPKAEPVPEAEPTRAKSAQPVVDLKAFQDPDAMLERVEERWNRTTSGQPEPAPVVSREVKSTPRPASEEPPKPEAKPKDDFDVALAAAVTASLPDAVAKEVEVKALEVAEEVAATSESDVVEEFPKNKEALDREALRSVVATLLREELQGELGERITRNVRKLVRREIMRALNSTDLE